MGKPVRLFQTGDRVYYGPRPEHKGTFVGNTSNEAIVTVMWDSGTTERILREELRWSTSEKPVS